MCVNVHHTQPLENLKQFHATSGSTESSCESDLFDAEAGHGHDHGRVGADLVWTNPAGEDGFLFGRQSQFPCFVPGEKKKKNKFKI